MLAIGVMEERGGIVVDVGLLLLLLLWKLTGLVFVCRDGVSEYGLGLESRKGSIGACDD